jgi:chromosomal replication initiator protein
MDDLQELTTRGTMDLLFPIFNHLHLQGKKLIFTCDRAPYELDGLTDRLIDRFKWGVTEQLPKPDLELRKKILHSKALKNGLTLSEDVLNVIAEDVTGSVRELEGIVMGIITHSIALNCPITVELAREVMKHSMQTRKKIINFDMIVEATADFYNLNPDVIFSKSRLRDIADARQVIMYLANKLTGLSSPAIGQKLNRRHATVLYGIKTIKDRIPFSKDLSDAVEGIESVLKK